MLQKLLLIILSFWVVNLSAQTTIINMGGSWKYLDNGSNQGTAWKFPAFDDAAWKSGNAKLGYGAGDVITTVSYGSNANQKHATTYFRRKVSIANLSQYVSFTLSVIRDDGMIVYVNGVEVARDNVLAGPSQFHDYAPKDVVSSNVTTPIDFSIPVCAFVEGENTIAVEMHQATPTSADMFFNLRLVGNKPGASAPTLTRVPYLQAGGKDAITIRWRTSQPCLGKVSVGTAVGNYTVTSAAEDCPTVNHEIRLSGLLPDTKYFYQIATVNGIVFQGDASNFFTTLPPDDTKRKLRFSAFGDCGIATLGYQEDTFDEYRKFLQKNNIEAPDGWLLLGDNAYIYGTDSEYSANFFGPYQTILKNHKLYPVPGNHDYTNSIYNQKDHLVSYFSNFTFPQNGELGGIPSKNPAYYSYDIGDVHFLALDSYGEERGDTRLYDTLGPQAKWVKQDLDANTKKWTIAYFHHPPYSMGSHNSDVDEELIKMRGLFTRILERYGVDLVIAGHSHDYERSKLIQGHYGLSSTYSDANFAKSTLSGAYTSDTSCPYITASSDKKKGTVYVVSGSAGAMGAVQAGYPHKALPYSVNDGGIFYFEVEDNRLDAKFIRRTGQIWDQFTILKDVNQERVYAAEPGEELTLSASWPGNYNWGSKIEDRQITALPVETDSVYVVRDKLGCLTDKFTIKAAYNYTFTGSGNWSDVSNWENNKMPPDSLPGGSRIYITPANGECVLNKSQHIMPGGKITITEGKQLRILGKLEISE
jgi:predicted phosphodiesterase